MIGQSGREERQTHHDQPVFAENFDGGHAGRGDVGLGIGNSKQIYRREMT